MGKKQKGTPIHGWINLDKPSGMTSMQAIAAVRRLFDVQKIGHAGTLDPMATGVLPIACGEATKAVHFMQNAGKAYDFTVKWGEERNTDDAEGEVTNTSDSRPSQHEIEAILSQFTGEIEQVPPQFSAIKINGERSYVSARKGEEVELAARTVTVHSLAMVAHDDAAGETSFAMQCSKGTYVRSIARDIGRALGCFGHVTVLRRTQVGLFNLNNAYTLEQLENINLDKVLLPLPTVLDGIKPVQLTGEQAERMKQGHPARLITKQDLPILNALENGLETIALCGNAPIAIVRVEKPAIIPTRVFVF